MYKFLNVSEIILKNESYKIIGLCMEVHTNPGMGFKEVVYKDALELEFSKNEFLSAGKKDLILCIKDKYCLTHILPIISFTIQ